MIISLGNSESASAVIKLTEMCHSKPDGNSPIELAGWKWFMSNVQNELESMDKNWTNLEFKTKSWYFSSADLFDHHGEGINKQLNEKFEGYEKELIKYSLGGKDTNRYLSGWYFSVNYRERFKVGANKAYEALIYNKQFLEPSNIFFGDDK